MQTAQTLSANPFAALFQKKSSIYDIDLSQSTLIEVISEYEKYKRKVRPQYSLSNVKYNLSIVQVLSGKVLEPSDVTDMFYSTFSFWMTQKGVKYTTQENYCSQIRACLQWGIRHNCRVSSTYDQIDIPKGEPFTIALTPDEVSHIAHFDVGALPLRADKRRTLEKVRDHFVLSCNLGQRYSDMVRITPENFERNIFRIVQKKTGCKAVMDIDRFALQPALVYRILEKYGHSSPWTGDITNFNHDLHELLRLIGQEFNETYKIEEKIEGKMAQTVRQKWELVASHTARRTFATFNSFRQIPIAELMRATGHKSMSCFAKYIKFGD